jgi:hypothetical protein
VPKAQKVDRPVHRPDDADEDEFIRVRSISHDDLIRLSHELGPDFGLMAWLAVCLSMRFQEIAGLTVASVRNLISGEIRVLHALSRQRGLKETKTEAGERYFVDRDLAPDIATHITYRGLTPDDEDAYLFVNSHGSPLCYSSWRDNFWVPALHRAGLAQKNKNGRYLGLHDLRSMNRSIMNAQGVDLTTARFRFGHANGDPDNRMDNVYSRTNPRQNRQASEKIHAVVRPHSKGWLKKYWR